MDRAVDMSIIIIVIVVGLREDWRKKKNEKNNRSHNFIRARTQQFARRRTNVFHLRYSNREQSPRLYTTYKRLVRDRIAARWSPRRLRPAASLILTWWTRWHLRRRATTAERKDGERPNDRLYIYVRSSDHVGILYTLTRDPLRSRRSERNTPLLHNMNKDRRNVRAVIVSRGERQAGRRCKLRKRPRRPQRLVLRSPLSVPKPLLYSLVSAAELCAQNDNVTRTDELVEKTTWKTAAAADRKRSRTVRRRVCV